MIKIFSLFNVRDLHRIDKRIDEQIDDQIVIKSFYFKKYILFEGTRVVSRTRCRNVNLESNNL